MFFFSIDGSLKACLLSKMKKDYNLMRISELEIDYDTFKLYILCK